MGSSGSVGVGVGVSFTGKQRRRRRRHLLQLSVLGLVLASLASKSTAATFNCSVAANNTCQALVDYVSPNQTTLSHIQTLFGVKNFRNILGANTQLPDSATPGTNVSASQTIRIPFRCRCANGTGSSVHYPVYTVNKDDTLSHIAEDVFGRLVTYQEIAAANSIPDPNTIHPGQELRIPLPCNCDRVNNTDMLHYGLVVKEGSSVEEIAQLYGADQETLLKLNGLADPKDLKAASVFDVPLRACNSLVNNESLDYPLLVPNGTYRFTAQNCIKCNCSAASNWTLQCEPSKLKVTANSSWQTCPSTVCGGTNILVGDTASTGLCEGRTCAYAGYNKDTILSALTNVDTCPAPSADNSSAKFSLEGSRWGLVFICINFLVLLPLVLQ